MSKRAMYQKIEELFVGLTEREYNLLFLATGDMKIQIINNKFEYYRNYYFCGKKDLSDWNDLVLGGYAKQNSPSIFKVTEKGIKLIESCKKD